jgi:hypothetical protein
MAFKCVWGEHKPLKIWNIYIPLCAIVRAFKDTTEGNAKCFWGDEKQLIGKKVLKIP